MVRSIHDVAHELGIDQSRIRFFEVEFRDVFEAHGIELFDRDYAPERVQLVAHINRMVLEEGLSAAQARRALAPAASTAAGGRAMPRIVAVTSGKGGVGKTTISINLAMAVAGQAQRVLLLDADLGLANVHVFAGLNPRATINDVLEGRAAPADALADGPGGVRYLCGVSGVLRAAESDRGLAAGLRRVLDGLRGEADLILVDTGAGISAPVLDFLSLADDILVVSTPNIASTLDAYGIVKVAREERFRGRIHLVMNQVAGHAEAQAVAGRIAACADRFLGGAPRLLGYLVHDPMVEWANQQRRPLMLSQPDSANARQFEALASALCAAPTQPVEEAHV